MYLLQAFFSELQEREAEFGIADIQLGLTTLEEVFLNIAKQAELETASAEGSLVTVNLPSGSLQVRSILSSLHWISYHERKKKRKKGTLATI